MTNVHHLTPAPPSSTIEEADVTIGKLVSILNSAVIENETDSDGLIHATDGLAYPIGIAIEAERKLLCLFASYEPEDAQLAGANAERILAIVNDLNEGIVLVRFQWSHSMLIGQYWMTFDTRIDPRHLIKMLRMVGEVFVEGIRRFHEALALGGSRCV